jgi:predicted secreted protein
MVKQIINFIFIYIIVFWTIIFCVLPFGVKREENPQQGNDHGAPANANIKIKMIWTAILSLILVGSYFILKEYGIIDLDKILETN